MTVDLLAGTATIHESDARWSGFEQLTGWSIMGLAFSSGEILGLRVFPYSDFAPYRSIWHRDADGAWSVYVDGPSLEVGCPRWWGPALESAALASITVDWMGPSELRVSMAEPALDWRITFAERPMEYLMNHASAPMPTWTWRPRALRAPREWMARWALGMGRVRLDGVAPAGMPIVMMPRKIYGIAAARAVMARKDLGAAIAAPTEPRVGDFALPIRGVLAIGDFRARIRDQAEYLNLRAQFSV